MSDEIALLRAIRANPDEDTPRLVYADWLQENDRPERAEFIRLQCELAHLEPWTERAVDLSIRARQLLRTHRDSWIGELPPFAKSRSDPFRTRFHRGFPYALDCTASQYLKAAPELARASVIQDWTLNNLNAGAAPRLARSKHLARVRELTLRTGYADALQAVLSSPHTGGLRHLSLEWPCYDHHDTVNQLGALFELPSVRGLASFRVTSLLPGSSDVVVTGLANHPPAALKRLDLNLPDLSPGAQRATVAADFWRELEELALHPTDHNIDTLEALSAPALRTFCCWVTSGQTACRARLFAAPFLSGVVNLRVLFLDDPTAAALSASPIAEQLRVIDLTHHFLSVDGLRRLLDSGRLAGLVKLTMDFSGINGAAGEKAVDVITQTRGLKNLRLLDLSRDHVAASAAPAIVGALNLPNLRAVAMRCAELTDEVAGGRFAVLEPTLR